MRDWVSVSTGQHRRGVEWTDTRNLPTSRGDRAARSDGGHRGGGPHVPPEEPREALDVLEGRGEGPQTAQDVQEGRWTSPQSPGARRSRPRPTP